MKYFAALIIPFLFITGCNGISVEPEKGCYIPEQISEEDKNMAIDLSAEIKDTTQKIGSAGIKAVVTDKTKSKFVRSGDVNCIYAMTYAACLTCKLTNDKKECADGFRDARTKCITHESGKKSVVQAIEYSDKILNDIEK
ncbi:hypothetical protein [Methylobacter psychrophilus]|uniref:hypothetical protein n=1 Tax=Methylobacter psychrophilus TaxID=96941 RepID=UPI0021D4C153|nr:hypothetical protein [Methylobacter psychrophilus]